MTKKKTVAARKSTAVAARKSTAATKTVKLYASDSMLSGSRPDTPVITRGEARNEKHYFAERDGSIRVPASEVDEFLAMGCARTPQGPVAVVNHVMPD